jgi:predicted ATPase with chaperone activity
VAGGLLVIKWRWFAMLQLLVRVYHRSLILARIIAGMNDAKSIRTQLITEAIHHRKLNRSL